MRLVVSVGSATRLVVALSLLVAFFLARGIAIAADTPPKPITLHASGPSIALALQDDDALPMLLTAEGGDITDIRVVQWAVAETSTRSGYATKGFSLCPSLAVDCQSTTVSSGQAVRAWLLPANRQASPGHFQGNVTLASSAFAVVMVPIEFYVTSLARQIWGTLTIFAFVVISARTTLLLRARYERDQRLLLAAAVAETLLRVKNHAQALMQQAKRIPGFIHALEREVMRLTTNSLENHRMIAPFPMPPIAVQTVSEESYAEFIKKAEVAAECLNLIVDAMLEVLSTDQPDLLDALDKLALEPLTDPTNLSNTISSLVPSREKAGGSVAPLDVKPLRIQVRRVAWISWVFVWATVTVVGSYVLVWTNPGFGTAPDYLKCALWGLGLPATMTALQALTTQSVTSTLGFTWPK